MTPANARKSDQCRENCAGGNACCLTHANAHTKKAHKMHVCQYADCVCHRTNGDVETWAARQMVLSPDDYERVQASYRELQTKPAELVNGKWVRNTVTQPPASNRPVTGPGHHSEDEATR